MPWTGRETGVAKNIRVIEWLKADLLASMAVLFKAMVKGSEDLLMDALSSIVITCYLLGRRLGINYSQLDLKIEAGLRDGIDDKHKVEEWYGDLSGLLEYHLDKKR